MLSMMKVSAIVIGVVCLGSVLQAQVTVVRADRLLDVQSESTGFAPGILEAGTKEGVADGAAEALKAVRYQIKHGAKVIKICATAGVLSFEGPVGAQQYSEDEMVVIVREAKRHGIKVAAHAHGLATL